MAARNILSRFIRTIFDRGSAKKTEAELAASLGAAGKKGGENFLRESRAAFDKTIADLKVKLAKGLIDPKLFKAQADLAAKTFNQSVVAGMEKARAAGTLTDQAYLKLGRTLKRVGDEGAGLGDRFKSGLLKAGGAIAGFFALHKITSFVADSFAASLEAEDSVVRLTGVLKPLGIAYAEVSGEVEAYLDNLQKTTRFGDEDGRQALVNLIVATGDYRKSLALMDVTAKIAEKRHTTMAEAAQTAADASRGVTRGMKDLGISAGETGDLIGKINLALGELALEGGQTKGGKLAITKNLLGEVKEAFGDALLGGTGFANSTRDIQSALIDLTDWIKANRDTISDFSSLLIGIARAVGTLSKVGLFLPRQAVSLGRRILGQTPQEREAEAKAEIAQDEALALARIKARETFDRLHPRTNPARGRELTKEEQAVEDERKRLLEQHAKEIATELQRIANDTAISRLQLERGLTEELAREMVRRGEILKHASQAERDALEAAWRRSDQAKSDATPPTPKVIRTEQRVWEQKVGQGPEVLPTAQERADAWESPWMSALKHIQAEVAQSQGLFHDLGEAWAESGTKGLAKFAWGKAKENFAWAIEMGAKALGAAFTNPPAVPIYLASAAEHSAAAGAWSVLASTGGGGGKKGSGAGGAGGFGAGGQAPTQQSAVAPTQEIHLHYRGPKAFSPEMEDVVVGNIQGAKERYGNNVKIIVHKGG